MAARAYWQGQIRLALVSIPVEVYPATKSGPAIAFHQIHEPSGQRIKYEKTAPGIGAVPNEEIAKGFEISKGNYVLLEDKEIDAVKIESRKTLELVQFVDSHEIDVFYFDKPYFVVPADDLAEEAYIVLREALRAAHKVAIGQLSVRGREQLVSLKPCGRGIVMEVLRYADEVRRAQTYFNEIAEAKPDEELLDLATTLIDKKAAPFKPDVFHDRYVDALRALIDKKSKAKGKTLIEDPDDAPAARGGNVIDLMAALKKSVGGGAKAASDDGASAKSPAAKKPAARKATPKKPATVKTDDDAPAPARTRKRA